MRSQCKWYKNIYGNFYVNGNIIVNDIKLFKYHFRPPSRVTTPSVVNTPCDHMLGFHNIDFKSQSGSNSDSDR